MSTSSSALPPDDIMTRCPRLGHQVPFKYCRVENTGAPCFKTLDCWYNQFDVVSYFRQTLSDEAFAKTFMNPGRPKVQTLMDLIRQAQGRVSKKPSETDDGQGGCS